MIEVPTGSISGMTYPMPAQGGSGDQPEKGGDEDEDQRRKPVEVDDEERDEGVQEEAG